MVSIIELYNLSENEWLSYLKLLKACNEEIFHKSLIEGSWSIENILRHLIGSLIMINNNALNTEKVSSELNFLYTDDPKDRIPLEKIEEEYLRINTIVKKGIEEIDEEKEKENIKFGKNEIPRGRYLIHMLAHDHNHFGQVIWLLRRQTNWSMEEIRKILNEN
ncbi:MAG: hypothetical protein FK734_11835 [Asgard group archaeon]|nr:hypothetical protein [Asgard group archaeon]